MATDPAASAGVSLEDQKLPTTKFSREHSVHGYAPLDPQLFADAVAAVHEYNAVTVEGRLLAIEFVTLQEYLFYFKSICCGLNPIGSRALLFFAAAVSDFYVRLHNALHLHTDRAACLVCFVPLRRYRRLRRLCTRFNQPRDRSFCPCPRHPSCSVSDRSET